MGITKLVPTLKQMDCQIIIFMTRYILLAFLTLFMPGVTFSAIDSVRVKVVYDTTYSHSEEEKCQKDMTELDIGDSCSHFYSLWKVREQEVLDSVNNSGTPSISGVRSIIKKLSSAQAYNVFKNFPRQGTLVYTDKIIKDAFKYEEDMPQFEWTLLKGDTVIAGYQCQKATGTLRGRMWTAWYSPDIPIQDGPWKLGGLPGLILGAADSSGLYSFYCTGIERGNDKPITLPKEQYIDCSPEELQSVYNDYYSQGTLYLEKVLGIPATKIAREHIGPEALKKKKATFIEIYNSKK